MFILKSCNYSAYIAGGPRRNKKEGICLIDDKSYAMRFETREAAEAWLEAIKDKQRAWGFKSHSITRAFVIAA